MTQVSRRTVTGLATAGVAVPLLAACGSDTASDSTGSTGSSGAATSSSSSGSASASASAGSSDSAAATGLTSTSDIEVGGGKIFADEEVVVTQPTAGTFKCFSAVCTHQGCLVSSVEDGEIICTCHGSHFSISTGEPDSGPASSPLPAKDITVTGDQISLA